MLEPAPHPSANFGNRVLDALPPRELDRIAPFLRKTFLQRDQAVQRPGEPILNLHFPVDAFAWAWTESPGTDHPISVMTVGRRGVIEWARVLASDRGDACFTVVSPGSAWRLPVEVFDQLSTQSALRRMLLRYANSCILNAAYRLACNAEHNVDQRLARWLLWVADESAHNEFAITHQQIAEIAAIRRPSISLALSAFQREGLVRSNHGRLTLIDRLRLQEYACSCYQILRDNCEAVFKEDGTR